MYYLLEFFLYDYVSLLNLYNLTFEVVMCYDDIWLIEMHHHPLIWNILCTCIDLKLSISLARGDFSALDDEMLRLQFGNMEIVCVEISWLYDSALRLSAQTRGDCLFRFMDHAISPWVMNSRCIFVVLWIYGSESTWHLRHINSWCHIALHLIASCILVDFVLLLWLYVTWSLIIPIDDNSVDKYNVDS